MYLLIHQHKAFVGSCRNVMYSLENDKLFGMLLNTNRGNTKIVQDCDRVPLQFQTVDDVQENGAIRFP